ncbi:MAG: Wzz/FepE/Etk N-terminal domain-containing protein, partial [Acidiferrobacterales bacterium]
MNEEAIEPTKDLADYLDALRRRRKGIMWIATALMVVTVLVAFLIPPVYRSSATILIEEQEIPKNLIRSTITAYAWQRIQTISQRVMTRSNLLHLISQFGLYPNKRRSDTTEELVRRMRDDVKLTPITARVIDPTTGQPRRATIAFKLSYDGDTPVVAQKVDNELTTLYLNENLKTRTEQATNTYRFLTDQAQKLQKHITHLETKIASFKEKHLHSLPDLQRLNLELLDRNQNDLIEANNELRSLQDRKTFLESQLAQIDPNAPVIGSDGRPILDPQSRLEALETEYATERAEYYPDYPDVVRLKRQIAGLKKQIGNISDTQAQAKEVARLKAELSAEQVKFSADYPDVVKLKAELAALQARRRKEASEPQAPPEKPQNPAYLTLNAELQGVKSRIAAATRQRAQLQAKNADFEKYLAETPSVQRQYRDLRRDYENSQQQYLKLKSKQMDAKIGEQMEKDQEGERLSLIDPPDLPQKPAKPNRFAIIILGFILSVGGGLGYAAITESMDKSVHGARGLNALLGEAPLSVIPYIENSADHERHQKHRKLAMMSALAGLVAAVLLVQFLWIPWDILWFK